MTSISLGVSLNSFKADWTRESLALLKMMQLVELSQTKRAWLPSMDFSSTAPENIVSNSFGSMFGLILSSS